MLPPSTSPGRWSWRRPAAPTGGAPQVTATVLGNHSAVQVTVSESVPLSFGKLINMASVDTALRSTAKLTGTTRLCLLALDPLAPGAGIMAGLLIFEDRWALPGLLSLLPLNGKGLAKLAPNGVAVLRACRIISDNARTLLGTIYLPVGRLIIDSKRPVADESAYTVIIARMIDLYDGPNLMPNARYDSTDIPVPDGVGPSSADTQLT
ncbi:TadG family pilus assembly protein [Methylobacterium sp.]|uniref:TadG family pilus assembly protein n=1 Tax=Methylobacterium sp. TaxID=409 RepID=UPI0025EEB3C4|nr:TadG family pilus assembly protein [Methylobacterium sp.]MBY0258710.1 hypothetical protein [Methylobacterium sp.]